MADGDFRLISATGDIIDLNPLLTSDSGVQAVAGLTGFGLPAVEVQYQVGAGDGATFRGRRVSVRDIDLPLFIAGIDRAGLKVEVNRLARALAGECILQWDDGDDVWELKVRRVGGGEFVYGTDTTGEMTLTTTITLRSGDPYWRSSLPTETSASTPPAGPHRATWVPGDLAAAGSASSYPVITVHGPTLGFSIGRTQFTTAPTEEAIGETFMDLVRYTAFIANGSTVTVDMERGTVTNESDENVYYNLAPGPRFFALEVDEEIVVETDNYSDEFAVSGKAYRNYIRYPKPKGTLASSLTPALNSYFANPVASATLTPDTSLSLPDLDLGTGGSPKLGFQLDATALTPGKQYRLMLDIEVPTYSSSYIANASWKRSLAKGYIRGIRADNTGDTFIGPSVSYATGSRSTYGNVFTMPPGMSLINFEVLPPSGLRGGSPIHYYSATIILRGLWLIDADYTDGPFDGNTPNNDAYLFSWDGTAGASTSRATAIIDASSTAVDLSIYKRNWLVV